MTPSYFDRGTKKEPTVKFQVTFREGAGAPALTGTHVELLVDNTPASTTTVTPVGVATFELRPEPAAGSRIAVRVLDGPGPVRVGNVETGL